MWSKITTLQYLGLAGVFVGSWVFWTLLGRLLWRRALFGFPELRLFEKPGERRRAFARATRNSATMCWGLAVVALMFCLVFVVPAVLSRASARFEPHRWTLTLILLMLTMLPMRWVPPWVTREAMRRRLREALLARGVRVCLRCGHDLRGISGGACPECGAEPAPLRSNNQAGLA